jgi:hypothetical protein
MLILFFYCIIIHMNTLKKQYIKLLSDKMLVNGEDLTPNELILIEESFNLFLEKLDDIKILNDELKRVTIELINLKAMHDDSENYYDDNIG